MASAPHWRCSWAHRWQAVKEGTLLDECVGRRGSAEQAARRRVAARRLLFLDEDAQTCVLGSSHRRAIVLLLPLLVFKVKGVGREGRDEGQDVCLLGEMVKFLVSTTGGATTMGVVIIVGPVASSRCSADKVTGLAEESTGQDGSNGD